MVSASVHVLALLGGGVRPVAGRHSFFYESCIHLWWRSHSRYAPEGIPHPPFLVRSAVAGRGPCACGYLYCDVHRFRILILADAWSGMIVCR